MKRSLAVFAIMLMLISLSACGDATNASASSPSTGASSVASSQSASLSSSSAETKPQDVYEIGDTATLGNWSITVTACDSKDKIADSSGYGEFTPDEGNKFIVISASISNNGKQSGTFLPSFATNEDVTTIINYNDGYEYQLTNLIGLDTTLVDATMNPLTSKEGIIAFEAPDSVITGAESLILLFSLGEQSVSFSLR